MRCWWVCRCLPPCLWVSLCVQVCERVLWAVVAAASQLDGLGPSMPYANGIALLSFWAIGTGHSDSPHGIMPSS